MVSIVKKRKTSPGSSNYGSKVFSPFRALGNITTSTPFTVGTLGGTYYIATSVGRCFQIYDAATLHLLFVSSQTSSDITCLEAKFQYVYAAYGNTIGIYKRGKLLESVKCLPPSGIKNNKVVKICVFGDYLIGVCDNNYAYIFKKPAEENSEDVKKQSLPTKFYAHIKVNDSYGQITNVLHPATYLNKIVITTPSHIMIFNIRSLKLIHRSRHDFSQAAFGAISTATLAPVLDCLALGTSLGKVVLLNLRTDKIIKVLDIASTNTIAGSGSAVSSISFRTDGMAHTAIGLRSGDAVFWDLNNNTRLHRLPNVHRHGLSKLEFLNGQAVFISSGNDNQLREWVFDPPMNSGNDKRIVVPPPRHLRSRGGHSGPPRVIDFLDEEDHFMLSAAEDRTFWSFSLRKDSQAQEISQRPPKSGATKGMSSSSASGASAGKDKIPEMTSLAISQAPYLGWEDIITGHQDEPFARTWNSQHKRLGRHLLPTIDSTGVSAVCVSACGNFALVGSNGGGIGIYNLQSGVARKQIRFHDGKVAGLAMDNMNKKMVSVGHDGMMGFYDFNGSKLLGKLDLESPATILKYHQGSDLAAVVLDDLSIIVVDVVTRKIVRQLMGHSNRITGIDFSPDGRWIVSSSLDGTVRTWDLPTGGCIDGFFVDNIVTGLKFSPTGNFLATVHVTGNGISLWTNKAQFKSVATKQITEAEFGRIGKMPNAAGEGGAGLLDGALEDDGEIIHGSDTIKNFASVEQIGDDLITLSLGSRNKYSTIVHLDTIKKRNKPLEAPKKPELAPFFLQTFGDAKKDEGTEVTINADKLGNVNKDLEEQEEDNNNNNADLEDAAVLTRIANGGAVEFENKFTKLVKATGEGNDEANEEFLKYLVSLSPSSVDLEIRSLDMLGGDELTRFVKVVTVGVSSNKNWDLLEAIMNVLLRTHGDIIQERLTNGDEELEAALQEWGNVNKESTNRIDELVKNCAGVISFLAGI
ncbi:rRNA-processing protein [Saccharomycopsis crataegensis]|uniref:rRNA-processing protein n=1 Tax=Saccharomycopsis crataegensis TaxID=43959 RepID=A0AAV5QG29_9ASCO|nr:rRNA-processing protein [Saccharomycopsis crataegensis]